MGSMFDAPKINTKPANNLIKQGMDAAKNLKPSNFSAGGLSSSFNNGTLSITPSADRLAQVGQLASQFGAQANDLAGLRAQYAPGYSQLRAAQLASIENARQSSVSNLRDNLARRRVLGSSFASDAEARANLDFENQKNNVISDTYLKELDATNNLINEEYTARVNQVNTGLNELNLEANLGTELTKQANDILSNSAQLQAQLAAQGSANLSNVAIAQGKLDAGAAEGAGKLLGTAGTALGTAFGGPVGGALGGLAGGLAGSALT